VSRSFAWALPLSSVVLFCFAPEHLHGPFFFGLPCSDSPKNFTLVVRMTSFDFFLYLGLYVFKLCRCFLWFTLVTSLYRISPYPPLLISHLVTLTMRYLMTPGTPGGKQPPPPLGNRLFSLLLFSGVLIDLLRASPLMISLFFFSPRPALDQGAPPVLPDGLSAAGGLPVDYSCHLGD